jgi:hypothetical protein
VTLPFSEEKPFLGPKKAQTKNRAKNLFAFVHGVANVFFVRLN